MKPKKQVLVRTYGCTLCQVWHVQGLDPLYDAHVLFQGKHQHPREIIATSAQIFALTMKEDDECTGSNA